MGYIPLAAVVDVEAIRKSMNAKQNVTDQVNHLRSEVKGVAVVVKKLMNLGEFKTPQIIGADHGEMRANIMLSYRHLEDAAMRLGKVIQACDGGVSCYDKSSERDTATCPLCDGPMEHTPASGHFAEQGHCGKCGTIPADKFKIKTP